MRGTDAAAEGCGCCVCFVYCVRPLPAFMPRDIVLDPRSFSKRDRARLEEHRAQLADVASAEKGARGLSVRIRVGDEEEDVPLPPALAKAVAAALADVADGHAVQVSRVDEEVTTSEAAELLNVSRPYLVRLLEEGAIPHRRVGTHRRVRRADVLAYRARQYQEAEEALQALADQAQALGLGYE